jgi:hypothetical protein
MAKVSRSVLKEIVKECLVEILSEGLLTSAENIQESKSRKPKRGTSKISPEVFQKRNKMLKERTQRNEPSVNVDHLTDDPMMREIFADTAATTLRSQPLSESSAAKTDYVPGDAAAKAVFDNDLEDLFEGAQNWAALAFNDGKK